MQFMHVTRDHRGYLDSLLRFDLISPNILTANENNNQHYEFIYVIVTKPWAIAQWGEEPHQMRFRDDEKCILAST